jgi:hypothetical protein
MLTVTPTPGSLAWDRACADLLGQPYTDPDPVAALCAAVRETIGYLSSGAVPPDDAKYYTRLLVASLWSVEPECGTVSD